MWYLHRRATYSKDLELPLDVIMPNKKYAMSVFTIFYKKEHSKGKKSHEYSVYMNFFSVLTYFLLIESIDVKPEVLEDQLERKYTIHIEEPDTIPMFQGFVDRLGMYPMHINKNHRVFFLPTKTLILMVIKTI